MDSLLKGVRSGLRATSAQKSNQLDLTSECWADFDFLAAMHNPSYGMFFMDRGQHGTGNAIHTATGSATALWKAGAAGMGSVLELDAVSTSNGQGSNYQWSGIGVNPQDGMTIYGEFFGRVRDIATAPEFFMGLATLDTTVIASDANSATNWLGFLSLSGGAIIFGSDDNSLQDLGATTIHTMVDGDVTSDGTEYFRLAFKWKVGEYFRAWGNRVEKDVTDVAITAEPAGATVLTAVLQSNGTTDPIAELYQAAFGYKY